MAGTAVPERRVLRELQLVLRKVPEQLGGLHPDLFGAVRRGTAYRLVGTLLIAVADTGELLTLEIAVPIQPVQQPRGRQLAVPDPRDIAV